MATERIVIQFRADGTRVVTASIKGIGKAAKGAASSTNTLKRALQALIAIETARRIIQLADTFTLLQNRIRVLTTDQAGLVRTTQALFETSNRTRVSIESTALIFQRLTLATKGLLNSETEVLEIVETLNKALKISGTTTQEAAAGTIQLAQGFAFGALRGDELRSVMEQLPIIASILEKELGVTRGELRKLGKEGAITSAVLVSAFQNAREEIAEKFGRVIPTIADQFVVLRNNIILMIGDLEEATGLFGFLGQSIAVVAVNLETFAKITGFLVVPTLVGATGTIIGFIKESKKLREIFKTIGKFAKIFAAAIFSVAGIIITTVAGIIIFRKELAELGKFLLPTTRRLQVVNAEAVAASKAFKEIADKAKAAAIATAKFTEKLEDETDKLKEQTKFLFLAVAAQDQFILNEKVLAALKKSGTDLDIKGREEEKKAFLAAAKLIQLQREESDLLRKLEGPLVKINRERETARRLLEIGLGPRQKLLDLVNQQFVQNDNTIKQLKNETRLLGENTVVAEIANQVIRAGLALQKKGVDLNSTEGKQALTRLKTAIEENRAAAIRRDTLRDFNIDLSERIESENALADILNENLFNEKKRNTILEELTVEQAKVLFQLGTIADFEFDQVIEKTLEPLIEQNALLRKESGLIGLSNAARAIAIERFIVENALKKKGVDLTRDIVRATLDENDALKRVNDQKERRNTLERSFGIDRTENKLLEADLNALLASGNRTFDQRIAILRRLNEVTAESTDFVAGLKQSFLDIDATILTFGMDIGGFLVGAIDSAADALTEFAVDGFQDTKKLQQALSDLFRQLAKDIIAATIRLIIFRTIQAALGGVGGAAPGLGGVDTGVTDVSGSLSQSAGGNLTFVPAQAGAFLQAGQPSIVGERGPEPFVPTSSGRVLPNAALAAAPAPQITIVNVTDPKEVQQFLSTTEGEDVIMNVIQKRNRQVRGLLK